MAQMAERTTKTDSRLFICNLFTDSGVHRYIHFCSHGLTETGSMNKNKKIKNEGEGINENCFFIKWTLLVKYCKEF